MIHFLHRTATSSLVDLVRKDLFTTRMHRKSDYNDQSPFSIQYILRGLVSTVEPFFSSSPRSLTWFVDHVVNPALALLHPQSPPLIFCHQVGGGHQFRQLLWKHDMSAGEMNKNSQRMTHRGSQNTPHKKDGAGSDLTSTKAIYDTSDS